MKNSNVITDPKTQLFTVQNFDLQTNLAGFDVPKDYASYFTNDGRFLGIHKGTYNPVQPADIFKSIDFIDGWQFNEFNGGKNIEFTNVIKPFEFVNGAKKLDSLEYRFTVSTSYDGSRPFVVGLFVHRLICTNGMTVKQSEQKVSFKNTKGNTAKALSLANDLTKVATKADEFSERIQAYNRKEVTTRQLNKFVNDVLGIKDRNELTTRKENILNQINESIAIEFGRTGANLWGLLNGVTHYTNHVASADKDTAEYIRFGTGAKLNEKALIIADALIQ